MNVISQINRLYLGHQQRSKYLLQRKEAGYMTIDRSKGRHSPFLNDGHMKAHVEGRHTVGVFANYRNEASFMTFDIDFADDWKQVTDVAYRLIDTIEASGVEQGSIYPSFSGNKGVHIDLFFDKPVNVDDLKRFYWYTLYESGLSSLSDKIEFRPTQSQGVKVPLGYHQKTMRYCSFLDSDDLDNPLPYDFVERVEQLDAVAFVELVESLPSLTDIRKEASSIAPNRIESHGVGFDEGITAKTLEKVLVDGFPAHGTRHNYSFRLALLFRDMYGYSKEDTYSVLVAFLRNNQNTFKTPIDEAITDTERILHDVFDTDNDYKLIFEAKKEVTVKDNEVWAVVTANDKDDKPLTPARKKLLFTLYVHWKRHGSLDTFFATYEQLTQGSGMKQRRKLLDALEVLEEAGHIDIVRRNHRKKGSMKHEANIYRIKLDTKKGNPSGKKDAFTIKKFDSNSLNRAIDKTFTKRQLRKTIPLNHVNKLYG